MIEPHEPVRSGSFVLDGQPSPPSSYDGINFYNGPDEYAQTPESGVGELSLSPWFQKVSPNGSPLSRTSSLSGSDYVSTPPHAEQTAVYHLLGQPLPLAADNMISQPQWFNNAGHSHPHFAGGDAWNIPPLLPSWSGSMYEGLPLTTMDHCVPPFISSASSSFYQPPQIDYCHRQHTDSVLFTRSEKASNYSEPDSDDSDKGDDSSTCTTPRSSQPKYKDTTSVLKLGRWSNANDPFTYTEPRDYVCPLPDKIVPHSRMCDGRFRRPEHLRRHIKTVHGSNKPYFCRVPQCNKAFSRGDNLRDHYWTHLSRGGRAGRNEKMSLEELKLILGPREKKLTKKLKRRLAMQWGKQKGHQ